MAENSGDKNTGVAADEAAATAAAAAKAAAGDWRDSFPDELKASPALKDIANPEALAKSYIEQSQFLGSAIRTPGPDASEEQRTAFYAKIAEHAGDRLVPRPDPEDSESMNAFSKAMGRPDEASGYKTPDIEGFDTKVFDAARETFFDLGLTDVQAQGIAKFRFEQMSAVAEAAQTDRNTQHAQLEQEWGKTYQPRLDQLTGWLKADKAPPDIADNVKDLPSAQVKFLFDLYTRLGSETNNNDRTDQPGIMPPAEALARSAEIMERLHKMSPGDPAYAGLVQKRVEYMKLAHPNASQNVENLRATAALAEVQGVA